MALISTKIVQQIATAIANSQSEKGVALGTQQFKELRERFDYQRGLAAFLSQCTNLNDRLLALLQLRLMAIVTEEHTIFTLRSLYFEDVEKVAVLVRNLMCYPENIRWAPMFIDCNLDYMGGIALIRYIQLLFLYMKEAGKDVVEICGQVIQRNILQLIESVGNDELSLRMLTVVLALFYEVLIEEYMQLPNMIKIWQQFDHQSRFFETPWVAVLKQVIDDYLANKKSNLPPELLRNILTSTFHYIQTNNELLLKYCHQELRFICKNCNIFHCDESVIAFLNAVIDNIMNKNKQILVGLKFGHLYPYELEEDNSIQKEAIGQVARNLTNCLLTNHYQMIEKTYGKSTSRPFCIIVLPLIVCFNSNQSSSQIEDWVRSHLLGIVDQIGRFLSGMRLQNRREEEDTLHFMNCWMVLTRFKSLIDIQMLPHICGLMQDISVQDSKLSQMCYNFIEEVWEELAALDFCSLSSFLTRHLHTLNSNSWDHQFSNYSCFLQLAHHVEESYHAISHLSPHQQLYQESVKAQQIMVELMEEANGAVKEGELNLLSLLICLTTALLGKFQQGISQQKRKLLRVDILVGLIQRYELDDKESLLLTNFRRQIGVDLSGQLLWNDIR